MAENKCERKSDGTEGVIRMGRCYYWRRCVSTAVEVAVKEHGEMAFMGELNDRIDEKIHLGCSEERANEFSAFN